VSNQGSFNSYALSLYTPEADAQIEILKLKVEYLGFAMERLKLKVERQATQLAEQPKLSQSLRNAMVIITNARFPDLAELARQKAAQIDNIEVLNLFIEWIITAPDEAAARWLLRPSVA
jgi:hypothetical protein